MEKMSKEAFVDYIISITIWEDWKERFNDFVPFLKHYFRDDEILILIKDYLEYALEGADYDFICEIRDEEYVVNSIEDLYDVIMIARKG